MDVWPHQIHLVLPNRHKYTQSNKQITLQLIRPAIHEMKNILILILKEINGSTATQFPSLHLQKQMIDYYMD